MGCGRRKPKFATKGDAKKHGAMTYGRGAYAVRKVKGGWKTYHLK